MDFQYRADEEKIQASKLSQKIITRIFPVFHSFLQTSLTSYSASDKYCLHSSEIAAYSEFQGDKRDLNMNVKIKTV